MTDYGTLLIAFCAGVLLSALVAWLLLRRSAALRVVEQAAASAEARAQAERTRGEVALAETRVREAQADAERARREIAEERTSAAEARTEVAYALAQVAGLEAQVVAAVAERDAAIARAADVSADRDALTKDFQLLSSQTLDEQTKKADASAEARFKATEQLMAPVRASLEAFNARLNEVEKERVAMTTELRAQVAAVRVTGDELRRETASLSKALRKPQVRGAWGELQLKRVAEVAGMLEHCDFALQTTSQTSEDRTIRPDMKVMLTDDKFVYVDSKVPLTSFLDAHETTDEAEQQRLLGLFAKNVRGHIDQLAGKNYFKADSGTPEFVVLFVPSEALAAEALAQFPDLHEYAARKSIVLATPTTLIAMLRAVAYSWKQAALSNSAAEVFQLGRELYDRLGTMGNHFDKVGRALNSTVRAYNDTLGSLESRVFVHARRFRDLHVTDLELPASNPSDAHARGITAPELIASVPPVTAPPVEPVTAPPVELPEARELSRPEPDVLDLVVEAGQQRAARRGTMAG